MVYSYLFNYAHLPWKNADFDFWKFLKIPKLSSLWCKMKNGGFKTTLLLKLGISVTNLIKFYIEVTVCILIVYIYLSAYSNTIKL